MCEVVSTISEHSKLERFSDKVVQMSFHATFKSYNIRNVTTLISKSYNFSNETSIFFEVVRTYNPTPVDNISSRWNIADQIFLTEQ